MELLTIQANRFADRVKLSDSSRATLFQLLEMAYEMGKNQSNNIEKAVK